MDEEVGSHLSRSFIVKTKDMHVVLFLSVKVSHFLDPPPGQLP